MLKKLPDRITRNSLRYRRKSKNILFAAAVYFLLINLAFVFLYPFLKVFVNSFKSADDLLSVTVNWIPRRIRPANYAYAATALNYLPHLFNSAVLAAAPTAGMILSSSLAGYGFARYRFKGREFLFACVLLTLIIPSQTVIIPLYELFNAFGWLNIKQPLLSWLPLIISNFFGVGLKGGLFIFIFRQTFRGIPAELEDASRLDGCGMFQSFLYVAFPLSRSAILVSSILSIVWQWNNFFEPKVFIVLKEMFTLPMMLANIFNNYFSSVENAFETYNSAVISAATILVLLPMLIFYFIIQRFFLRGIERTGLVE